MGLHYIYKDDCNLHTNKKKKKTKTVIRPTSEFASFRWKLRLENER